MAVAHTYKNSIRPWIQLEPYCLAVSGIRFHDLLRHLRLYDLISQVWNHCPDLQCVCGFCTEGREHLLPVWRLASSGTKNCMDICVEFAHLRP